MDSGGLIAMEDWSSRPSASISLKGHASMYSYALLDPRPTPEAQAHNDRILGDGSTVLGIEVTIPALAARCGLGNIDPQHLGGDAGTAAIETVATMSLSSLPPDGATLVTVRADSDAIGAMAVLEFYARGEIIPWGFDRRLSAIARADKESAGTWPGPRPLGVEISEVSPLAAAVMDHRRPLDQRVELASTWLETGDFEGYQELWNQLHRDAEAALASVDATVVNGVAVVVGTHRLAMSLGYRLAPVVVATNPEFRFAGGEPHLKHTVARWNSAHPMDWDGLRAALQELEPGWGGSTSIMGSPQGVASRLTTDEVAELVSHYLAQETS